MTVETPGTVLIAIAIILEYLASRYSLEAVDLTGPTSGSSGKQLN